MSTLSSVARSIRIRKAMKAQQEGDEDVVCLKAKERSNTESREARAELRAAHREFMPGGTGYYEAKAHFEECVEQQEAGKSEFRNKVYLGDCIDIMSTLPKNCVDMVFCDLPYGTTQNKWDCPIDFDELWEQYNRVVKPNGAIVLTAQSPFDKKLACSNLKQFRYEWIWEKNKATGHLNAKKMPMKAHENILVFYRKLPTYNPQMTEGHKPMHSVSAKTNVPTPSEKRNYNHVSQTLGNPGGATTRCPRDVLQFPVVNNDSALKFHPTQKPVEMIEYFIKTYSNEGDVVLDNCMGSGSSIIACKNTRRQYIGIENDEGYFEKAEKWINSHD